MVPTINPGDLIVAVPVDREPREGEVVAIGVQGQIIVHRIAARFGPYFVHIGDNSKRWGLVRREQILGLVGGPRKRVRNPRLRGWVMMARVAALLSRLGFRKPLRRFLEVGRWL